MRKRYIQDPATGELIPFEQWGGASVSKTHYVAPDITPYQSMITGEMITSRSHHREHLKKHNCFEIGNETKAFVEMSKPKYQVDRNEIRNTLKEIINSKNYRR